MQPSTRAFLRLGRTLRIDNRIFRCVDPGGDLAAAADDWDGIIDTALAAPEAMAWLCRQPRAELSLAFWQEVVAAAARHAVPLRQVADDALLALRLRAQGADPGALLTMEIERWTEWRRQARELGLCPEAMVRANAGTCKGTGTGTGPDPSPDAGC